MAQPKSSASRSIRFIPDLGTFIPQITSSLGEIFQRYDGNNVSPVFDSTNPVTLTLTLYNTSTGTLENLTGPEYQVEWFLGHIDLSTKIVPDITGSIFASGTDRSELKIVGDLAKECGYMSSTIWARIMRTDSKSVKSFFTVSMPIRIEKVTSNSWSCYIYGTPSLTIRSQSETISLGVNIFEGLEDRNSDISANDITWYKHDPTQTNGWKLLGTGKTITFAAKDIDASEFIRVEVSSNGELRCTDSETIRDDSDPITINPCPIPADETLYQSGGNDTLTYTPTLVTPTAPDVPLTDYDASYTYTCFDAYGTSIPGLSGTGPNFTITSQKVIDGIGGQDFTCVIDAVITTKSV